MSYQHGVFYKATIILLSGHPNYMVYYAALTNLEIEPFSTLKGDN